MDQDPWDDSVLINAFNSAIAKYKDMHGVASKRTSETTEMKSVLINMNDEHGKVTSESKSDVPEIVSQFTPEKDESHNVGSPSREESQMHPIIAAENSSISHEPNVNHSFDWVEYERQQITYQLSQLSDQREKLEQRLSQISGQSTTATSYNSYYGGFESHHQYSYPYTSETCYQCQWNGYYNSTYGPNSSADHLSIRLQCQHCGYMNKQAEGICKASDSVPDPVIHKSFDPSPQPFAGQSALPEMVAKAVSEALKAIGMEQNSNHTSFSDVAGAWFLAGFQTSRIFKDFPKSVMVFPMMIEVASISKLSLDGD